MILQGEILENRYVIMRTIGKGRWGNVYLADDRKIGKHWAIKEVTVSEDTIVNLLAEPELLKRLNHPSIPRIVDIFKRGSCLYIVEDYFAGTVLKDLIPNRAVCTEQNVIQWGKQLANILNYLHSLQPNPIIYRDMKPSNIIIDQGNRAKLIDFGIAREHCLERVNDTVFLGTLGYAAPELFSQGSLADQRTDIYGLGMTLYHVLTGRHPAQEIVAPREIDPSISPALERLILDCIHQDKERRPENVQEIIDRLEHLNVNREGNLLSRLGHFVSKTLNGPPSVTSTKSKQVRRTIYITVGSTARGVGASHFALNLSAFLAKQGFKVALLEQNAFPVFGHLRDETNPCDQEFIKAGVHIYPAPSLLTATKNNKFDFVVLDIGKYDSTDNHEDYEGPYHARMIELSDMQIVVAGSAIWQLPDLWPFLDANSSTVSRFQNLRLVIRTPDPNLFEEIKRHIAFKLYCAPFNPNPLAVESNTEKVYHQVLGELLTN